MVNAPNPFYAVCGCCDVRTIRIDKTLRGHFQSTENADSATLSTPVSEGHFTSANLLDLTEYRVVQRSLDKLHPRGCFAVASVSESACFMFLVRGEVVISVHQPH